MNHLNIHYFQHVAFEGLGSIETWANRQQHKLSASRFFENVEMPDLNQFDWLIVMGGPMGAYDENKYPWLKAEKHFIEKAIKENKTVIVICLGAQLIADVLGAKVYSNKEKEIGWFKVQLSNQAKEIGMIDRLPQQFTTFHWHGDTFELPSGALHLAQSEACHNQAFLYQEKVLGLQFHFEVTREGLKNMVNYGRQELKKSRYVQTADELLEGSAPNLELNTNYLFSILNSLSHEKKESAANLAP